MTETESAQEVVAADNFARDEDLKHLFCVACEGRGPKASATARCGTVARKRGTPPTFGADECVVCVDLHRHRSCQGRH